MRPEQPGVGEEVRHDLGLAGVVAGARPRPTRAQALGEEVEQRAVVDRVRARRRGARVAATTGWPARSSAARIASARAGSSTAGVRTPSQISALGACRRCASLHTSGIAAVIGGEPTGPVGSAPCPVPPDPAVPGCASSGCGSARFEAGPGERDHRRPRRARRPRHGLARRAGGPRDRAHRRHGDRARAAGRLFRAPVPGRRRGAQRRRRADRLARVCRVGDARDAGLPDVDDGGRADLRRRGRRGGRRRSRGRRRGRRHPGRRRVRRQLAQRRRDRAGRGGRRGPRARRGAAAARSPRARSAPAPGMVCFDWKGGIGTASRVVPEAGATVGVLVLANFGSAPDLRVDGVPVGRLAARARAGPGARGGELHRRASPPTRRSAGASSSGSRGAPGSASRGPARSRTTGAARSSSRSRRRAGGRARRGPRATRRSPTGDAQPALRGRRRRDRGGGAQRALGGAGRRRAAPGASRAGCRTSRCSSCCARRAARGLTRATRSCRRAGRRAAWAARARPRTCRRAVRAWAGWTAWCAIGIDGLPRGLRQTGRSYEPQPAGSVPPMLTGGCVCGARPLRGHRAARRLRLVPLHALPAPHRHARVAVRRDRARQLPASPQGEELVTEWTAARRRLHQGVLLGLRRPPLQPPRPTAGRSCRSASARSTATRHPPAVPPARRQRGGLGADPGRRAA